MDFQKTDDPVLNAINKYRCHLSIVMINSKIDPESIFSFKLYNMMMVSKKLKIKIFRRHHNKVTFQLEY